MHIKALSVARASASPSPGPSRARSPAPAAVAHHGHSASAGALSQPATPALAPPRHGNAVRHSASWSHLAPVHPHNANSSIPPAGTTTDPLAPPPAEPQLSLAGLALPHEPSLDGPFLDSALAPPAALPPLRNATRASAEHHHQHHHPSASTPTELTSASTASAAAPGGGGAAGTPSPAASSPFFQALAQAPPDFRAFSHQVATTGAASAATDSDAPTPVISRHAAPPPGVFGWRQEGGVVGDGGEAWAAGDRPVAAERMARGLSALLPSHLYHPSDTVVWLGCIYALTHAMDAAIHVARVAVAAMEPAAAAAEEERAHAVRLPAGAAGFGGPAVVAKA